MLLPHLGVRMHVQGTPPDFPCVLMANHRSYLDPVVITHDSRVYPVAKAEVAGWPIVGYGVKVSGVLFLKRESAESRRNTLQGIADKLAEGFAVLLFPEGTTHAQASTLAFRSGGFKLAAENGFPVVPVAIEYRNPEDYWIGDDGFLPHFFRRFGEPSLDVFVHYGSAILDSRADVLMSLTKEWIDAELLNIQKSF